jgi:hypothetical protein
MGHYVFFANTDELVVVTRKGEEMHLPKEAVVALVRTLQEGVMSGEDYASDGFEETLTEKEMTEASQICEWIEKRVEVPHSEPLD